MYRMMLIMVFAVSIAGCAAAQDPMAEHHQPEFAAKRHFEGSIAMLSDKELFSLELVMPEPLMVGMNKVELIIHHRTVGDVVGAEVSAKPWMPSMGHGVMVAPVITERGGGLYSMENVAFSMAGAWQLQVTINMNGVVDQAAIGLPEILAAEHGHAMSMTMAPHKDIDTTVNRMTEHFMVSYAASKMPVPINRIHSWNLMILTSDSRPVNDAVVTVEGTMPEHGHGLPTKPEIRRAAGEGMYRVDGMKFNMPGWWEVTFSVKAGEVEEQAVFNLQLQ